MIAPSLLNVTNYWASGGADVLTFLRMGDDGNTLRLVCKEMRDNVKLFPWMEGMNEVHVDSGVHVSKLPEVSCIRRCVPMWRRCYPNAKVANVGSYQDRVRSQLVDNVFKHFSGVQYLDMTGQRSITDAALVHLKGINTLYMTGCSQSTITDACWARLRTSVPSFQGRRQ